MTPIRWRELQAKTLVFAILKIEHGKYRHIRQLVHVTIDRLSIDMSTKRRTPAEVRKALEVQMKALAQSIRAFEAGDRWEAPRIAVSIANIVHSKGRSRSVLDRMNVKEKIPFIMSGYVERDGNLFPEHPLVVQWRNDPNFVFSEFQTRNSQTSDICEAAKHWPCVTFDSWWKVPVFKTGGWINPPNDDSPIATTLSRSEIIMTLRDQDGGAHFDEMISNQLYSKISKDGIGMFLIKDNELMEPITGIIEATAAQIGHELMLTLLSYFQDIPTTIGMRR